MAQQMHAAPGVDSRYGRPSEAGQGWRTFAAVMFFAAAALNTLYGIAALANDDYFSADELLFGDLSMWGVIYLCLAALQVVIALLILRRNAFGVITGVILTLIHATVALTSIGAYPVWSIVALVIDGLIIYGLTVHGLPETD